MNKTVLCPRCGVPCTLTALRRPGAFRMVDPDGQGHAAVCLDPAKPAALRYRPVRPNPAQPAALPIGLRRQGA